MSSIDRRLALIPALWLTLASAAPAPTHAALVECRMSEQEATATLATLPITLGHVDLTEFHAVPRGLKAFGYRVTQIVGFKPSDEEDFGFSVKVRAPYAEITKRVLAAHGLSECASTPQELQTACTMTSNRHGKPHTRLWVSDSDKGEVAILCSYPRAAN